MTDLAALEPTPLELPSDDWAGWLDTRARGALQDSATQIESIRQAADGDPEILQRWNDANIALSNAYSVSTLLSSVHPDVAVIELAEQIETEAQEFSTDVYLDTAVFAKLNSVQVDEPGAARVLADALRDFRRSGVDRDEATRDQVRALDKRLTDLGQAFSRNIRDGRADTKVPAAALEGLPADWIAAHPADADGNVTVTTEYPDTQPFLTFVADDAARRAVAQTFFNLAYPANEQVLSDLLATRHEKATLLGYDDWAAYDAEVKMIKRGTTIGVFIDEITADAEQAGRAEIAGMAERIGAPIDSSNVRFALEQSKRELHGVDSQAVREYFDFTKVHDGLLAVTGRLFGVTYQPVTQSHWHHEVSSFDVLLGGTRIGRIHLDLHPRDRKYNHAAQFDLVSGVGGRQLPEGVLVCNFPKGLMEHHDVVTLFHEFGHLLHHVLAGRHPWVRFSGVATEWDFVEAPSQMLEEWAWDATVLRTFATNAAGEPIPTELVGKLRAAHDFGKGFLARTQMFYAAISYRFHVERPADLTARMLELYDEYSLVTPLPDTHFFAGFGHLEGYSSGYYTYMWSQVIAKDMFSAFDPDDLFAPGPATAYRDKVLTPGGSADAADLVADFLGRDYNSDAFRAWLNG